MMPTWYRDLVHQILDKNCYDEVGQFIKRPDNTDDPSQVQKLLGVYIGAGEHGHARVSSEPTALFTSFMMDYMNNSNKGPEPCRSRLEMYLLGLLSNSH